MTDTLRKPPQALEAEAAVLGSILLNPDVVPTLLQTLRPDHMYLQAHRKVFEAIVRLATKEQPVDITFVTNELRAMKELDAVGGQSFLSGLLDAVLTTAHCDEYARLIVAASTKRRLIQAAADIAEKAYDESVGAGDAMSSAVARIVEVSQDLSVNESQPIHVRDLLTEHLSVVEHRITAGKAVTGIPWGFERLDAETTGSQPGELWMLGADSSMGKSIAAEQVCVSAAEHGFPALFFSLEMSRGMVADRLFARTSGIDHARIRTGRIPQPDRGKLLDVVQRVGTLPYWIDPTGGLSISQIQSRTRMWVMRHGVKFVAVDYLLLVEALRSNRATEEEQIRKTLQALKNMAKALNISVLVLNQLSRHKDRLNKAPVKADLKGCLPGETLVTMADGERKRIDSITPGDSVQSFDESSGRFVSSKVTAVIDQGVRPTIEIALASGRSVRCTHNHPLYRDRRWVRADQVAVGDTLAIPRSFGSRVVRAAGNTDLARLAGYMLGDGYCQRHRACGFINSDPEVLDDVRGIISRQFPMVGIRERKTGVSTELNFHHKRANGYGRPGGNEIRQWLKSIGLGGQMNRTKSVPEYLFSASDNEIWNALAGLWGTDGTVTKTRVRGNPKYGVEYSTVSRELALGIQTLLSYVGVASRIDTRPPRKARCSTLYAVRVGIDGYATIQKMPLRGHKASRLAELATRPQPRPVVVTKGGERLPLAVSEYYADTYGYQVERRNRNGFVSRHKRMNRERAAQLAHDTGDATLAWWASSDLNWDTVVSVRESGKAHVWDIEVPAGRCFVANNILVHNSQACEAEADVILLLWRPEFQQAINEGRDFDKAQFIIAKQRNARCCAVEQLLDCKHVRFVEPAGFDGDDSMYGRDYDTLPE